MYDALDPDLFSEPSDPEDPASATFGEIADGSLARQGEILDFLERRFSRYPFSTGGGIVDDYDNLLFALETQTRPVYSKFFFTSPPSGDSVVVHELAHQWFGDSVALAEWKHIWLNEGFATYAEWMWSEEEGLGTAQELFDALYNGIPATDPFWSVVIGDPGPELLFDIAVYFRGAMALHVLRQQEIGDRDFFRILHAWTTRRAGGHGTIPQFIRLAERISGQQLDDLFDVWLFTGSKPVLEGAPRPRRRRPRGRGRRWSRSGARSACAAELRGATGPGRSPLAVRRAVSATRLGPGLGALGLDDRQQGGPAHRPGEAVPVLPGPGTGASAAARSSGTTRSSTASSLVQDPSRLASSIRASPASVISPSARSRSTRSLFDRAQPLPRLRGENRSIVRSSSSPADLPSIQPKHSASRTASS